MIVDLVVKATVLLAVAWIAALALRRRTASTRHAVWVGLLAATLLLPAMAMLAPSITLPLLPARQDDGAGVTRIVTAPVAPNQILARTRSDRNRESASRVTINRSATTGTNPSPAPGASLLTPRNLLLGAWLLVALALALRIVIAHVQARRLLRACTDPSERLQAAVASVAASLGLTAPPVRIAPAGMMPAVIGVRRPAIMLPAEAAAWSDERLELVLLHECAHVRRRDAMMQVVAGLATSAYWWHPLAWVAARNIVRERELACDDMVIASGTPAQRYAEHLLDIARSLKSTRQPALAALAMARPSQLEGRLIALLEERPRSARPARALAAGLLLALIAVSVIAPLRLGARAVIDTTFEENPVASHETTGTQTASVPPQAQRPPAADAATRGQIDTALLDAILKSLKDVDADVRAISVSALIAHMKETSRVLELLASMVNDESADVRAAVIGGLVKTESPQASTVLIKALEDADPDVRQLALSGLIRLDRPEAIPHLAAALKDASEDVRAMAVIGIDSLNHPQRYALLVQAAADRSEDVRTLVAFALADETGADVAPVLARLSQDAAADVRAAAVMAIASMARDADLEPLVASLRDRDADVRAAAAMGLGALANKTALTALTQALKDSDADVRSAAAMALGSIGDPAVLPALTAALGDVDADVRKAAITAAAAIGGDLQARTLVASTVFGTVAGTIAGTLRGSLWGGTQGYWGRSSAEDQTPWDLPAAGTVQINGHVKSPGAHPWIEGLTVGQVVAKAGGLTERGTMRGITVTRHENGKMVSITGDERMVLRDRDIVTVDRRRF